MKSFAYCLVIYAISTRIIDLIMQFAPFAVACLIFTNAALFGFDLLRALGWFVLTVLTGLALQMFGVYSLSVHFLSKVTRSEGYALMPVMGNRREG